MLAGAAVVVYEAAKILACEVDEILKHRACEKETKLKVINTRVAYLVKRAKDGRPVDISHAGEIVLIVVAVVVVKMKNTDVFAEDANDLLGRGNPENLGLVGVARVNAEGFVFCVEAIELVEEFVGKSEEIRNSRS